jgi:hypothetical protein
MIEIQKNYFNFKNEILEWASEFGYTLSYAITRSFDESKKIIQDVTSLAVLAFVSKKQENKKLYFAKLIFNMSMPYAYQVFTEDKFFSLSPKTRAIFVLKNLGFFNNEEIAKILNLSLLEVKTLIENSKILLTKKASWFETSIDLEINETKTQGLYGQEIKQYELKFNCPYWIKTSPYGDALMQEDLNSLFFDYLENTLDKNQVLLMNEHFKNCKACMQALQSFKQNYLNWKNSFTRLNLEEKEIKSLNKILDSFLNLNSTYVEKFFKILKEIFTNKKNLFFIALYFVTLFLIIKFKY